MACPFLNSDQPENTHCTSLRVLLAVMSGKVTCPLGARQHQEFSSGLQPVPIPAQSHRRHGPAAKTVKWLVSACQPSMKKGSLKGDAIQTFPWEFLLFISCLKKKKKKVLVWTEMSHPQAPKTQIWQNIGKDSRSRRSGLSSASGIRNIPARSGIYFSSPIGPKHIWLVKLIRPF